MTTTTFSDTTNASPTKLALTGAIAGLGGGLVFGMLMGMMGMLPMVGMLVRSESAITGFVVHMVISATLGAILGGVGGRFISSWGTAVIAGVIYGAIWWVLGALILMPLFLGMTQMILVVGNAQWLSLMGHLLYGIITAAIFIPLAKRM